MGLSNNKLCISSVIKGANGCIITNISFSIPMQLEVRINVYNIMGQLVANVTRAQLDAGTYNIQIGDHQFLYRFVGQTMTFSKP